MQLELASRPLERIAMDILGPLPLTENGNKYILVVGDYFTKWKEAYPMKNMEATTVARLLVHEFICALEYQRTYTRTKGAILRLK